MRSLKVVLASCVALLVFASVPNHSVARSGTFSCTVNCWQPSPGCSASEHTAPGDTPNPHDEDGLGPHDTCFAGDCATQHPSCFGFAQLLPKLKGAVEEGDNGRIARVLARLGSKASINYQREAIQVLGCDNEIVVHLPIPTAELEKIADLLE